VPDPIHLINECWRVLRDGGMLFLAAPDRRFSTDHLRPMTPLEHLIDDHRRKERTVEDHHLDEFLRLNEKLEIPADAAARRALFDAHRERSIHIHVWDAPAFAAFLAYCSRVSAPFALLGAAGPESTQRREMVMVLQKVQSGDRNLERRLTAALAR